MSGCLIEAGLWLIAPGEFRYDAAIRVDGGQVVQIGTLEAVAYGNDHLPRLGARGAFAVPLAGALTPGASATLALYPASAAFAAISAPTEIYVGGRALNLERDAELFRRYAAQLQSAEVRRLLVEAKKALAPRAQASPPT